jgi:hypothetical protein
METPRRVGGIYDIFITEDMRFGFLARKPNLISSEFWEDIRRAVPVMSYTRRSLFTNDETHFNMLTL